MPVGIREHGSGFDMALTLLAMAAFLSLGWRLVTPEPAGARGHASSPHTIGLERGSLLARQSAEEPDQSCPGPAFADVLIGGDTWKAQTFVAGMTGLLTGVELPGAHGSGVTNVHILPMGRCHLLRGDEDPIGEAAASAGDRFVFDPAPAIEAGRRYAITVSNSGGWYRWQYADYPACYADGTSMTSLDAGTSWGGDLLDFLFTTFVETVPGVPTGPAPRPTSTPLPPPPPTMPIPPLHVRQAFDRVTPGRPSPLEWHTAFVISLPTGDSDGAQVYARSQAFAALLSEASSPHGYSDPNAGPALGFRIFGDRAFVETEMPVRCGDLYDLVSLYDKYGLVDKIETGVVDEVWFWEGGKGGFPEWAANGPEWSEAPATGIPMMSRQHALLVLHNELDLGYALHSFGHRFEGTIRQYFACDFTTRTEPWRDIFGCGALASDINGFVARPGPKNDNIGACGDVHFPPNIGVEDRGGYQYSSGASRRSICADWTRDGTANALDVSCADWGCDQLGFMLWWMQNLPGPESSARRPDGTIIPNWWPYLFGRPDPPRPSATPDPLPTATVPATETAEASATVAPVLTSEPAPSSSPTASPTAVTFIVAIVFPRVVRFD